MKPTFSIIIPALNEGRYLPLLLTDLSQQTYHNFEVIVVDGHSKDNTVSQAQKFTSTLPSLQIISSPKRHVSYQRNLGAKQARGDWFLFMDADNRLPPYFLQGIVYRLEATSPQIFSTYIAPDSRHPKDLAIAKIVNAYLELNRRGSQPSCLESMMGFQASVFNRFHGFTDNIPFAEGTELLIRAKAAGIYLTLFKDPVYNYSLRRVRKLGTLNILRNLSYYQLAHLTQQPLKKSVFSKLYPMIGGSFYDSSPTTPHTPLERIFHELFKPRSFISELNHLVSRQPTLKPTLTPLIDWLQTITPQRRHHSTITKTK